MTPTKVPETSSAPRKRTRSMYMRDDIYEALRRVGEVEDRSVGKIIERASLFFLAAHTGMTGIDLPGITGDGSGYDDSTERS